MKNCTELLTLNTTNVHFFSAEYGLWYDVRIWSGGFCLIPNREWRREGPLKWTSQSAEVESNQPMGKWRSKGRVIGTISRNFCKWQLLWYERMMLVVLPQWAKMWKKRGRYTVYLSHCLLIIVLITKVFCNFLIDLFSLKFSCLIISLNTCIKKLFVPILKQWNKTCIVSTFSPLTTIYSYFQIKLIQTRLSLLTLKLFSSNATTSIFHHKYVVYVWQTNNVLYWG